MDWKKGRDRDRDGRIIGPPLENVRETDEGYIIACVRLSGDPRSVVPGGTFAYTLAWRKQRLKVITNLPDRREEKAKAFNELKALAEQHNREQATAQ